MNLMTIQRMLVVLVVGLAATADAQLGGLLNRIPGTGSSPAGGGSATAYATLATKTFLEGTENLLEAAGKRAEAARCAALIAKIDKEGLKGNLGGVNEVSKDAEALAADKAALDKVSSQKVKEAAVKVGVATVFEAQAADAVKNTAMGGLAALTNVASVTDNVYLAQVLPGNLQSMLTVQKALLSYLKAKGIDPTSEVAATAAAMKPQ